MAKLRGAAKAAFLRRMSAGRNKKNRQSNKPQRSRSRSMARLRGRSRQIFRRRSMPKMNIKKEATKAGIGLGLGLGIKYGLGYFTRNNPQAAEWTRRGASIAAAFGGVPGELAYQVGDYGLNQIVMLQGGQAAGTGPGEAA